MDVTLKRGLVYRNIRPGTLYQQMAWFNNRLVIPPDFYLSPPKSYMVSYVPGRTLSSNTLLCLSMECMYHTICHIAWRDVHSSFLQFRLAKSNNVWMMF